MAKILLFGGGLQTLSVARGLMQHGHEVINSGPRDSVGKYSRFIDYFKVVDLESLQIQDFGNYIKQHKVEVIIPTEDEYAGWLSSHKEELVRENKVKIAVVSHELFQKVINKHTLLLHCQEHSIPHPKTIQINETTFSIVENAFAFPILLKPDVSNGSRGICRVETAGELRKKYTTIRQVYGDCSAQEYIQQSYYYNVMLYRYSDGSYSKYVVTKISRYYPIKGGSSSYCTTIENEDIVRPCKKLLDSLNWVGFADFDVLEKAKGDYRIIEINPRVPASLHAAYVSGIDFGRIIVDDLLYNKKTVANYTPGESLRCLGLDIAWFIASPNRFRIKPSWFKFWGKHLHYQEGGIKDWKSMIYSIWLGMKKQLSPSFRKAKAGMN